MAGPEKESNKTIPILLCNDQDITDQSPRASIAVPKFSSFDELLKNHTDRERFRTFLMCEYSDENLHFYESVITFVHIYNSYDRKKRRSLAIELYNKFINLRTATKLVNINATSREKIEQELSKPKITTFDSAANEVYALMKFDCYPRFLQSSYAHPSFNGIHEDSFLKVGLSPATAATDEYTSSGQSFQPTNEKKYSKLSFKYWIDKLRKFYRKSFKGNTSDAALLLAQDSEKNLKKPRLFQRSTSNTSNNPYGSNMSTVNTSRRESTFSNNTGTQGDSIASGPKNNFLNVNQGRFKSKKKPSKMSVSNNNQYTELQNIRKTDDIHLADLLVLGAGHNSHSINNSEDINSSNTNTISSSWSAGNLSSLPADPKGSRHPYSASSSTDSDCSNALARNNSLPADLHEQ